MARRNRSGTSVAASPNPATKSITLDDGKIYQLAPKAAINQLKIGAKVAVTVDEKTGLVTSIKKAS